MSRVSADREVAKAYARQAKRAGGASVAVLIAGAIATVGLAFGLFPGNFAGRWGMLALGATLTAALYAGLGHLQARAEAEALRHLADALDE